MRPAARNAVMFRGRHSKPRPSDIASAALASRTESYVDNFCCICVFHHRRDVLTPLLGHLHLIAATEAASSWQFFSSAAFDFTFRGTLHDTGFPSVALRHSCRGIGTAANHAEEKKISAFRTWEKEAELCLLVDDGVACTHAFQLCPFFRHDRSRLPRPFSLCSCQAPPLGGYRIAFWSPSIL